MAKILCVGYGMGSVRCVTGSVLVVSFTVRWIDWVDFPKIVPKRHVLGGARLFSVDACKWDEESLTSAHSR